MPSFFSRPDLSDIQFKQLPDSELHLSGITYFRKPGGFQLVDENGQDIPVYATGGTSGHVLTYIDGSITLMPGGAGGDPLFDSNRTTTRSGIPAVNVGGDTVKEFLEGYFFPAVKPSSTLTATNNSKEFGDTSTGTLNFLVRKETYPLISVGLDTTGDGSYNEPDPPPSYPLNSDYSGSFTYTYNNSLPSPPNGTDQTSVTYKGTGKDEENNVTNSTATVTWRNRRYYFLDNTLYTESDGSALQNIAHGLTGSQAELSTTRNKNLTLTFNNEFFYYMYPKSFGEPSFAVNGLPNNAWGNPSIGTLFEITYVNTKGYSNTYYVARSDNRITGDFTIAIT